MNNYVTKQRRIIDKFLSERVDKELTAAGMVASLGEWGINASTVYRNIERLEHEGRLHRFCKNGMGGIFYRYSDRACAGHFHIYCEMCGNIAHLDEKTGKLFSNKISQVEGYDIDIESSTISGICPKCRYGGRGKWR